MLINHHQVRRSGFGTFTRDRKTGFFSSFIKKKSSSSSSSSSQNLPTPPKRSSSFREMETQPHKKYEPTADFSAPPPLPQSDSSIVGGSPPPPPTPSHSDPPQPQSRCCGAAFGQKPSPGGGLAAQGVVGTLPVGGLSKPFPRSNSTSSMSAGLPDLERMALTLPRNRNAKPPLERTSSSSSTPENGRQPDEGTAQIRERPKAKMVPRGTGTPSSSTSKTSSSSPKTPSSSTSKTSSSSPKTPSSSTSKTLSSSSSQTHNHKVPVLISPR
ncbi:hypothetical protein F7725_027223 [Dissostichus mawsoni]|uniref:Uncharacterized protein n=1 Tax=Dissostichus mawsoni TaxID=36200 RepID=A0A7J5XCB5_DISMA|nr:hypothetical protein F7725_027223 [Dissostichus mawsoni]